jgi:hypothetical protein
VFCLVLLILIMVFFINPPEAWIKKVFHGKMGSSALLVQILMDSILWQRKLGSKEVHEHARVRTRPARTFGA